MTTPIAGVGGIFLRATDPKALYEWYEQHLGLVREHGCFVFPPDSGPGVLTLAFFKKDDAYFDLAQPAMVNFRVADLDALLATLTAAGVSIDPKRAEYDFGRFAWITDPEGNRIELWQPLRDPARLPARHSAQELAAEKDFRKASIEAFKTGLAATLCLWLGHLFGLAHSYWAAISAIVVMGSDREVTFTSCRDRMIGTALGAFLGWVTFYAWHSHYLLYGLAVAICIFLCSALTFDKAGRLAGVALTIVVLIHLDAGPGQAAIARFLEVGLGIVVALAVTLLIFPPKRMKQAL